MKLNRYTTVAHAVEALKKRGYTEEFKLIAGSGTMKNLKSGKSYRPDEMKIIEYHRFEGMSNPSDMSIVFAIELNDGSKGIIISSYGMYADMSLVEFLDKVKIKEQANSLND
ncbi:MAG: hypothetical protein J5I98_26705 [Phaeodactylibacter sp.]|nr:hypothetical protein [Phaeodactylibacter sp.]